MHDTFTPEQLVQGIDDVFMEAYSGFREGSEARRERRKWFSAEMSTGEWHNKSLVLLKTPVLKNPGYTAYAVGISMIGSWGFWGRLENDGRNPMSKPTDFRQQLYQFNPEPPIASKPFFFRRPMHPSTNFS